MPPETIDWFQNLSADRSHSHRQLDELCRRFGQSWRDSRPPRIDAFISAAAADGRRPLLLRLLPLDLEARWHYARTAETVDRSADDSNAHDELPLRPRLEDYVHRFSTILRLEELPADLIAHEYRVRHRWGDRPDHAEYVSRFSAQSDSIVASLNQVDAELADKGQAAKSPLAATLPLGSSHDDSGQKHPVVAGYEILGVLGRGGMGVVYRARQVRLNRMVALKMILSGSLASPEEINRFRSEAEAAAKLDHAGIVPIFEVGGDGDQHYFSMAYIEGKNLADQLARGPLTPRDAAEMVEQIAAAVEYAHQHGIIHRDLKPRNILLTVDGQPKITDFGLAKNLEADQGQTASGQILGTPGYMSPEQAQGKISAAGKHSDVYSLGAILYLPADRQAAVSGPGAIETLRQVVECEPVSPRLLNAAVTRDLETICLRCLAKDPAQRLASAQALADELGRTLRGEPIRSRRIGPVARVWRWARRKPLAAALCLAVVVLCVSLWAAGHFAGRANRGQQLTAALGEFETALEGLTLTGKPLTNLDALAKRIQALSPQRAAQARSRLNQSYANVIEQALEAPLASLRALNRSQPRRRSDLQVADMAYDEGRFSDALALYQKQLATGADGDVRQEARYKSALCLGALNRGEEASDAFEALSGEPGDRWPPLAGCQLWVARLRQQRDNDAEAIFENLSGRFSVEQLAVLAPADVRDEIMRSYGSEFYSLSSVLRFTAKRVEHAERALAIGKLLNAESADNLTLAWNLMSGYEARGDFDRALELARSLGRLNPWNAYAQRRYVRLFCLAGKTREALDVVEGILRQAPTELLGFRQTMLLERSRVNATMGALEDAETDVDMLLSQPLAEDLEREYLTSYAYLLQGSLRDRRGDTAGAQNAWREGLTRLRQLAARSGLATAGWLCLQILGSLTGDLTDDGAEQCFEHMLADAAAAPLVRVALPLIGRQAYIKTFRQMWRSPRGRALADDFAFDRLTVRQRYQLPLELAGAEFVRLEAFGGEWSPRQEGSVNQTAHDLYLAIVERGALRKAQLAQLALGWKGIHGALGWSAAAPALEPDLRARLAYVFAHRYLKLGQQADAEALFREAITALPDSPAAKLARADLDLLAAGHGLLVIESGAPRAVDVSIGPQGGEAAPLSIDRDGQASLPPGKYRLAFATPQDDLAIAPDEIELSVAAQCVARITDRWQPAPPGQSLPGLAPRPSVFPGLGRWQVETCQARGVTVAARSPDGRQLAVAGLDGRIRLYATDTMSLAGILAGHELAVSALAYQPGGTHLATGSSDGNVRIWRMPGGQIERVLRGHTSTVNCLAWSSDGGLLASGGDWHDPTVRLWQVGGERLATVDAGSDVRSVAIHPAGRWLAAAIFSKDVRLWHADGKAGPTLVGHSGIVESVAFSPDGQWLAAFGFDSRCRLWHVDGTAGPVIDRSIATNSSVAFHRETGNLLVLGRDSTVRTFRPTDGEWLSATLLLPLGRNVTIGSSGQLQALSPGAEDELLYYVETPERGYRMLSPSQFQQAIRHSP